MTVPEPHPRLPEGPLLQQSRVSCGAACLAVARMMIDPALTDWVAAGPGTTSGDGDDAVDTARRFGHIERQVHARTNAIHPRPERWQMPWPRALGTPPWGAAWELEHGAALSGVPYGVGVVRWSMTPTGAERLAARVHPGVPTLLYVGDDHLPRHVVLVFTPEPGQQIYVYDPDSGSVRPYSATAVAHGRLALSGWHRPWLTVHPLALPVGDDAAERATVSDVVARLSGWWPRPDAGPGAWARDVGR